MRVNEFVQKYGFKDSRKWLEDALFLNAEQFLTVDGVIVTDDLKRLVESWDLVQEFGGLINSRKLMGKKKDEGFVKYMDFLGCSYPRFLQAIEDVESCQ